MTAAARCGAPCPHGGRSAARKYSRSELGMWNHCNRLVKHDGDRCWQHKPTPDAPPHPASRESEQPAAGAGS